MNFREDSSDVRIRQSIENDSIDSKYGFNRVRDYKERTGFLINMHSVRVVPLIIFCLNLKVR